MSKQALHYIDPEAITPEHDLYSDKDDRAQDHVPDADDLVVTPDTRGQLRGCRSKPLVLGDDALWIR